ncbi:MAG TPA: hypothetical protein VKR21_08270 [Solirubrobacteraceae bacterium]|nr:hypothetical protein [Solirubrobacteraceae bacterium]
MRLRREVVGAAGAVAAATLLVACGGGGASQPASVAATHSGSSGSSTATAPATTTATTTATTHAAQAAPRPPAFPQLLPAALGSGAVTFAPAVRWRGQTVAWITRRPGLTTLTFDQRALALHLHSGAIDAGALGWRYGASVGGFEKSRLVSAFNGGFRLSTGAGGFAAYGRVAVPLRGGLASIVTYADGSTDIGIWKRDVPARGQRVVSVRQNLTLLIDHGTAAADLGCLSCWGATLGGVVDPARSALGITADHRLVWVGGKNLTVAGLAHALLAAHAVRAAELDINPEWVAGYLYGHRGGKGPVTPVAALPDQHGIPGAFLSPWSRDFFTLVAR